MSLFYEEEPTDAMREGAQPIPRSIRQMLPILAHHEVPARPAAMAASAGSKSGIDIYLKDFGGDPQPPAIDLHDIAAAAAAIQKDIDDKQAAADLKEKQKQDALLAKQQKAKVNAARISELAKPNDKWKVGKKLMELQQ